MRSILALLGNEKHLSSMQSDFDSEYRISIVSTKEDALALLTKQRYDFILIDIDHLMQSTHGNDYRVYMEAFWDIYPTMEIIILSPKEMTQEALIAVKAGASNYLTYPLHSDELKFVAESIYESQIIQSELDYLRDQFWEKDWLETIYTKSPLMKGVYEKIRAVAPTKSAVLLLGETGTGKGVLANLLHRHSNRKSASFISVHCGAIPDTLLESDLFGHEKGAFTGAIRRKLGKFEIASSGTIFLDEIDTMTPTAQIKLLQVLQDGTFQRVGGEVFLEADVRVIAATNIDLEKLCDEGKFRKDLYYRLNVFPIEVPALKNRLDDIAHLVQVFLKNMDKKNTKNISDIDPRVLEAFKHYSWPGNIRELENLIERACILETSSTLSPESFPSGLFVFSDISSSQVVNFSLTLGQARKKAVEHIERKYLKELLTRNKGKIKDSAKAAGITTRQLNKLMAKYGLRKEEFK